MLSGSVKPSDACSQIGAPHLVHLLQWSLASLLSKSSKMYHGDASQFISVMLTSNPLTIVDALGLLVESQLVS